MAVQLNEVDKVVITTLEDNFVDLLSMDNSEVVTRAMPIKGMVFSNSVLAEHGFASVVNTFRGEEKSSVLFDFGLSEDVAARNAQAVNCDLSDIQVACLSHGHMDHFGGMKAMAGLIGDKGLDLVLHPEAFQTSRFVMPMPELKITLPVLTRDYVKDSGFNAVESAGPMSLVSGDVLFLGQVPRVTDFEKGSPMYYEKNGEDLLDPIEDDTALVMNLKGKGLVVLTGCAHSGVINTVKHAIDVTGVSKVHCVMGGFHLSGPAGAPLIDPTIQAMKEFSPDYVIPTHCTGRNAAMAFEKEMPQAYITNMAGTVLTFSA
ncbi:MBL fold metallo-hydrolase [Desulfatibacillum aliphaticivorans]|uniref:MBL fold metallo-hydrolase n=1 Tax=Desulfatibacillum aliphaticivorans TaxID=218208 RepID=UPI000422569C|nr:MBL fold metallo-hydrolase [Desulfatibacillum aliphaticivorans]